MATDHNFRIKNGLTVGSVEVIDSSGKLTANAFGTNSNEKIEDVVADMITGSTHSNITVTYNDTNGTLAFSAAAQYGDSDVESYLDGGTSTPSFASVTSSGNIKVESGSNQVLLNTDGAVEITRSAGNPYIDFKNSTSDDYDQRLQINSGNFNFSAPLQVAGTTFIDTSLNLSNIGTISSGAITATTVNTGQGANELYAMNQNVRTTDSPTFDELTVTDFVKATGNNLKFSAGGTHVLNIDVNGKIYPNTHNAYDIGFSSTTAFRNAHFSGVGNFGTINTGQGATEVHLMNQNVRTTDSPTFAGLTTTGNIVAEDSEVRVGDTSGDNWTRIKHAQADGYGFDWQHDNATVIVNEQGSTNEVLVLGDVDAGNYSGLFGIAHTTDSGSNWTKKLDLKGNGELYIGASGTSHVYHEGHKPTYSELGTMAYSNLTGTPTIPTNNNQLTNGAGYATTSYVDTSVSNLVDSAPTALDTLNELAAALGDDANFSTTVTNSIATKLPLAGGTLTGNLTIGSTTDSTKLVFPDKNISDNPTAASDDRQLISMGNSGAGGLFQTTGRGGLMLASADDSVIIASGDVGRNYDPDAGGYHPDPDNEEIYLLTDGGVRFMTNLQTASSYKQFIFDNSGNATIPGTVTATGGNSTNWNTAYGWGNHASAGYLTSSSTQSKYLRSDTADTASGALTFTGNINQTGGTFISHGSEVTSLTTAWQAAGTSKSRGLLPFRFQNGATGQPESGDNAHWGLNIYAHSGSSGNYPYGTQLSAGSTQNLWHRWWSNGTAQSWRKIWDSANDGPNSGLNADLLDNEEGSYYLNYNNFTNTPTIPTNNNQLTNGAGYITDGNTNWNNTYGFITTSSIGTHIGKGPNNNYVASSTSTSNRGNYGEGVWAYSGYSSGSNRPFTYDATLQVMPDSSRGFEIAVDWVSQTSTPMKVRSLRDCCQGWSDWTTIWTSTTDGANSGLDADLLDGEEGSYYLNYNNFTNTPTIPTNNNQLTNGAGYITSADGGNAGTLDGIDSSQFLRSDTSDTMSGELNVSRNGGVTGSSAPQYSDVNIELQTSSNHVPGISFHRGGYSATTLYEYDGELYTNAWTTRAQTGKLISSGNIGSYAASWKYAFASNDGTNNGGNVTASSAQDGIYFNGTNGITTSASGQTMTLSGANLLRSDTDDTTVGTLTVNKTNDGIGLIVTRPANGNYSGTIVVGATDVGHTLVDSNRRPMVVVDGPYPVLNLNHTATSNSNHGPTIQFTHNDYNSNRQWVIGTDGTGDRLDFGVSGGTAGSNTNKNPHNGIAGYSGVTIARMFQSGVLIGDTGVYPNEITAPDAKLDVRGDISQTSGNLLRKTYNKAIGLYANGTASSGSAIGFQQITSEGWAGIYVDYNPYEGWGLYHDNPSNYFYITAELTTGNLGTSFTVPNRDSGTSTAYAKHRFDQNNGNFDAGGAITAQGNITAYSSDRRLKENFKPIESALDKVKQLNGLYFDWNKVSEDAGFIPDQKQNDVGLIAQDVQQILPQAVAPAPFDTDVITTPKDPKDKNAGVTQEKISISGKDYLTVKYEKLVPLLVEAIKEQQEQIEELKSIINTLMESK